MVGGNVVSSGVLVWFCVVLPSVLCWVVLPPVLCWVVLPPVLYWVVLPPVLYWVVFTVLFLSASLDEVVGVWLMLVAALVFDVVSGVVSWSL